MVRDAAKRIRLLLGHLLFQNAAALFAVQFSNYALQLLTVPYLARVLTPQGWGVLAIAQAYGQYASFFIDYGFDLSGTRETARFRNDTDKLSDLFASVMGAKLALTGIVIAGTLLLGRFVPALAGNRVLLWSAMAWAIPVGLAPTWYFQGIENMRRLATLDICGKAIWTIGIFLVIRSPQDGWKVLAVQTAIGTAVLIVNVRRVYQLIPFRIPTFASTRRALKLGWTMFIYRSSSALNSAGNALILGFFVLPQVVGYYSGAERIMKAFVYTIWPINQAFYPRLSRLHHEADGDSSRMARISLIVMGITGGLCGLAALVFAHVLVRVLLGKAFEPSLPVLRVFSIVLPLTALNFCLGLQFMLPMGMDRIFNRISIGSAVLNLTAAVLLAPQFSAVGMAWAMVISQTFALVCFCACLWRAKKLSLGFLKAPGNLQIQNACEAVGVGSEVADQP